MDHNSIQNEIRTFKSEIYVSVMSTIWKERSFQNKEMVFLTRIRQAGMFLEMLVKRQLRGHMHCLDFGRDTVRLHFALDSALPSVVSGPLWVRKMNSFKTLTAVQMRWENASRPLLIQLFPQKVPGMLARVFSSYASVLSLSLLFLQIMWTDK